MNNNVTRCMINTWHRCLIYNIKMYLSSYPHSRMWLTHSGWHQRSRSRKFDILGEEYGSDRGVSPNYKIDIHQSNNTHMCPCYLQSDFISLPYWWRNKHLCKNIWWWNLIHRLTIILHHYDIMNIYEYSILQITLILTVKISLWLNNIEN